MSTREDSPTEYDFHEVARWAEAEGWELVNIAQQTRLSEQREQERQSEAAAKARWRNRAEEAEATVAKVRELCNETPIGLHGDYGPPVVLASAIFDVLEGGE